ncbi:MAG: hypothetical protein A3F83_01745 [Candidatus Glassbacteria bacterium RIFCSPLOWO2_12_FULL_58_11]|uniref:Rieske domain-containing protein n=1 Tax=Candidatus Glassbacteria bacterium RIFCSPLOWO2_12_FULL_58_11 TaxID=1817867 RepID=A0A1F5YK97_9BACT|nr:MAG: hypothetical protein A3F83_01745 [Candidatus Glassbacteria bacterium RIFCSPLOWO2_12_FULL_58_11]
MGTGAKSIPESQDKFSEGLLNSSPSRRQFLAGSIEKVTVLASSAAILSMITGCGGGGGSPSVTGPSGPAQLDLSSPQLAGLANVGGVVTLSPSAFAGLPRNGIFIIRATSTSYVVLDRTCTHQACQVGAFQSNGIATCPCHGSQYNTSGSVARGPAPRALTKYTATIADNILTIQF